MARRAAPGEASYPFCRGFMPPTSSELRSAPDRSRFSVPGIVHVRKPRRARLASPLCGHLRVQCDQRARDVKEYFRSFDPASGIGQGIDELLGDSVAKLTRHLEQVTECPISGRRKAVDGPLLASKIVLVTAFIDLTSIGRFACDDEKAGRMANGQAFEQFRGCFPQGSWVAFKAGMLSDLLLV